jgi:processive 1,2-diacylglycerol beta-glucosyltransferase
MKILLVHASAGAGHMMAAKAIHDGLKKYTSHNAILVDALDKTYPMFKNMYRDGYAFMIKKAPMLWAVAFGFLDIPFMQPILKPLRRMYNAIHTGNLEKYLCKESFDYIISCHFMPVEVVSALKRRGKIRAKLITVVTDFDVHRIWLGTGVDLYMVASSWTRNKMISMGISAEKIIVAGIPTNEKFSEHKDVLKLKQDFGLAKDMFTVLIATGSFGIGPIEEIIKSLEGEFQIIVVSGHNKTLFETLSAKGYKGAKILGLVNNMDELMAVSDVMVTKPGGLSTSEALVSQLPMIFFNPIPGQEMNNIKVLGTYGVGVNGDSIGKIVDTLKTYRASKDVYLGVVARMHDVAKPNAVRDIIGKII